MNSDRAPTLVARLGLVDYLAGLELQEQLVEARRAGRIDDVLLLLRHPNVITLGRDDSRRYLKASEQELAADGYPVVKAGRGGEVTFHGPGQLIAYPILQLEDEERDLHLHLRRLEQVGIDMCHAYGLDAHRVVGRTGVWLAQKKIAAIGVRARSWVTFHGMSFNLTPELEGFDKIVPCGIRDAGVTCLQDEVEQPVKWPEVEGCFNKYFQRVFKRATLETTLMELKNLIK